MSVGHWWNDTDMGKQKYWDKDLPQCHFVHQKSHTDWPDVKPGPTRLEAGD